MNNFFKTSLSAILLTILVSAVSLSCKKQFDAPPADEPPVNMTANTTIAQLKARHTVSGAIDKIESGSDIIIRGIVVADDRSGNYYKSIVIQDSTGGIAVLINGTNLYTTYPVGREVFIKCNNLYLSDYSNQIQLGGGIQTGSAPALADISTTTIGNVIFKGTLNNVVTPKDVTVGQLGTNMQDKYQNTLIKLSGFRFAAGDFGKTYASAGVASPSAASFDLYQCDNLSSSDIELRTSNYSNFASVPLPQGIGSITAIYTAYRTFKQLAIRNPDDVQFTGNACVIPPPAGALKDIGTIRALYSIGSTVPVPDDTKITGIVISDRVGNNINGQNLILQQGNGKPGIVVRFTSAHNFNQGDSITVVVSGYGLSTFSNQLQISTVPNANAVLIAAGKTITPRTVTISTLNTEMALPLSSPTHIECTLLKIVNATASGGATYSGNRTLTDPSGNVVLRTGSAASFASTALPTGAKTWICYPQFFNTTPQVFIRNLADVQ